MNSEIQPSPQDAARAEAPAATEPLALEGCKGQVDRLIAEYASFLTQSPTPSRQQQRQKRVAMATEFRRLVLRSSPADLDALQEYLDAKFRQWDVAERITFNRGNVRAKLTGAPALVLGTAAAAVANGAGSLKDPALQMIDTGADVMAKGVAAVVTRGAEGLDGMKGPLIRAVDAGAEMVTSGASQVVARTAEGVESMTRRSKVPIMRAAGDVAEIAVGTVVEVLKGVIRGLARFASRS